MARVDNTGGSGFTVDNGTGLVVRTKLNQIIAALSTLNQGSGDPSIGVAAYVPHIDGNTLKIRNSANNAFVTLGDVSATNFGHAGLSAANTFTSTNIFQEDVTFDGATAGRDVVFDRSDNALEFADNAKAIFGTGSDLKIYHDGSNSYIDNLTGAVLIRTNDTELSAKFFANAQVELYYDNTKRIETTSSGATVTGNFNVSSRIGINQPPSTNVPLTIESFSSNDHIAEFYHHNNTAVGSITTSSSATAYNTSSDYRLKENVTAISDGITRLKTLKPSRFNFKTDKDTTVDGFIAHEVTAVPEAIKGTKDEVDSDNNPVYQGIDQSKLVPLLTAALQEAVTKIETLETKVAALEAK